MRVHQEGFGTAESRPVELFGLSNDRGTEICLITLGATLTGLLPANVGRNHLHGGPRGFHAVVWDAEPIREPEAVGGGCRTRARR